MLRQTARIIQQVEFLYNAGIHYLPKPDPQFALMFSYEEAMDFWIDLRQASLYEQFYYRPVSSEASSPGCEAVSLRDKYDLPRPPFPTTDHNVWCKLDELTLIIKGRKDA